MKKIVMAVLIVIVLAGCSTIDKYINEEDQKKIRELVEKHNTPENQKKLGEAIQKLFKKDEDKEGGD